MNKSERDIYNEKPTTNAKGAAKVETRPKDSGSAAVLHTTYGDIHIRLFPEAAPKAVENFVTHSKNGYYNGLIFHRVIPKFMIQVCWIHNAVSLILLLTLPYRLVIHSVMARAAKVSGVESSRTNSQLCATTSPTLFRKSTILSSYDLRSALC